MIQFKQSGSGGRIIRGSTIYGDFRVEWDASGNLISEHIDIKQPPQPIGTHLHRIIQRDIGIEPAKKCGCEALIKQMNKWGVEGCREHYETIIAHLVGQTDQLPASKRWFFKLPGANKVAEYQARKWVDEAIA